MIKAFYHFLILFLLFSTATQAQSLKKSFKLIDEKQFELAATELAEVMAKDSSSPQLWYGLALLNSDAAYASSDLFYAWNCINKSITLFSALNEKEQNKFGESLNITLLNELRTQIDDKLFKQVSASSNMELFLKHLNQCHGSRHTADVMLLRNALAFKNAESVNTVEAYNNFISDYPSAKEKDQAITKRNSAAFKKVLEKNTTSAFQQFMNNYPGAAEYQQAFDLRNALMLDSVIALNDEKPIREFISNMQKQNTQEHPVSPALMDRANNAIQKLTAKDHWIVFLSQGNLYKMNEYDFQKQQLTTSGNIFSFKCTGKGDIVYTTVANRTMQFFVLTQNDMKLCELKGTEINDFSTEFDISDDLNFIYAEYGEIFELSGFGNYCLWSAKLKKWEICNYLDFECKLNKPDGIFPAMKISNACPESTEMFFTKQVDDIYELFMRNNNGTISQISHTKDPNVEQREIWGEVSTCFSYVKNDDEILFSYVESCGDFCHGPSYLVNTNGTNQVLVRSDLMERIDFNWLKNGDFITIDYVDSNSNLIKYSKNEHKESVLANDVTQFDLLYDAPVYSFCLNANSDGEDVGGVIYTAFERNTFHLQGSIVTAELYSSYARNGSNAESTETEFSGNITDNKIVGNAIRNSYSQYGDLSGTERIPMDFTFSRISKEVIEINGQLYNLCK